MQRGEEHRNDRAEDQAQHEGPLAAELGGKVDDRSSDSGLDRHPPKQRAKNDGDVEWRELHRAAGNDSAQRGKGHARRQRHQQRHAGNRNERRNRAAIHQHRENREDREDQEGGYDDRMLSSEGSDFEVAYSRVTR